MQEKKRIGYGIVYCVMIKFYMRKAKRKKGQKDKQWSPNYYTENQ
jgi:hypothetical protein